MNTHLLLLLRLPTTNSRGLGQYGINTHVIMESDVRYAEGDCARNGSTTLELGMCSHMPMRRLQSSCLERSERERQLNCPKRTNYWSNVQCGRLALALQNSGPTLLNRYGPFGNLVGRFEKWHLFHGGVEKPWNLENTNIQKHPVDRPKMHSTTKKKKCTLQKYIFQIGPHSFLDCVFCHVRSAENKKMARVAPF